MVAISYNTKGSRLPAYSISISGYVKLPMGMSNYLWVCQITYWVCQVTYGNVKLPMGMVMGGGNIGAICTPWYIGCI